MRVELIYAPGCTTYRKALDVLETVIAEERLPLPVELSETANHDYAPVITVNGETLNGQGVPCSERLRDLLNRKWDELTLPAI